MADNENRWISKITIVAAVFYTAIVIPSATEADSSTFSRMISTAAATIPAHLLVYHATRATPKENGLAEALYCMIYGSAIERAMKNIFMAHNTALRVTIVFFFVVTVYASLRLGPRLVKHHKGRAEEPR